MTRPSTMSVEEFRSRDAERKRIFRGRRRHAAFTITDYYFAGQYKGQDKPCSGNERCVRGYFTRFVQPDDAFFYDSTAPNLGAWVLRLIR